VIDMDDAVDDWVPDDVKWLAAGLSRLKAKADRQVTEHHAIAIRHTLIDQTVRAATAGYNLETRERVESKEGVIKDLHTLLRATASSDRLFLRAWARVGRRTRELVWPRDKAKRDIEAGRACTFVSKPLKVGQQLAKSGPTDNPLLIINAPLAADAAPRIKDALANLQSQPPDDRRHRIADVTIDAVIRAIADAYEELTERRATVTYRPSPQPGVYTGAFVELCRDIAEHFRIPEICSIRRLRAVIKRRQR
jgi:hypothetical protein